MRRILDGEKQGTFSKAKLAALLLLNKQINQRSGLFADSLTG